MKILAGCLFALATSISTAEAADWWFLSSSKDSALFVDRSSIALVRISNKNVFKAWSYTNNSKVKDGVKNSKDLNYIDCDSRSIALKSYINYDLSKDVKSSETINDYSISWYPVAPDTMGEAQLVFVCNHKMGDEGVEFEAEGMSFTPIADLELGAVLLTPSVKPKPTPTSPPPKPKPRPHIKSPAKGGKRV